jgi:hypothetical protein
MLSCLRYLRAARCYKVITLAGIVRRLLDFNIQPITHPHSAYILSHIFDISGKIDVYAHTFCIFNIKLSTDEIGVFRTELI